MGRPQAVPSAPAQDCWNAHTGIYLRAATLYTSLPRADTRRRETRLAKEEPGRNRQAPVHTLIEIPWAPRVRSEQLAPAPGVRCGGL